MSVIIKFVLGIFIFYELYVIFSRKHPKVTVKDLLGEEHEHTEINPFSKGFDVAFGLTTSNQEYLKGISAVESSPYATSDNILP